MSFNVDERKILLKSVQIYAQMIVQKMGMEKATPMLEKVRAIVEKLQNDTGEQFPKGLSQEQITNVCYSCDKFTDKCNDEVAHKYPGKCDPILRYINSKETLNETDTQEES